MTRRMDARIQARRVSVWHSPEGLRGRTFRRMSPRAAGDHTGKEGFQRPERMIRRKLVVPIVTCRPPYSRQRVSRWRANSRTYTASGKRPMTRSSDQELSRWLWPGCTEGRDTWISDSSGTERTPKRRSHGIARQAGETRTRSEPRTVSDSGFIARPRCYSRRLLKTEVSLNIFRLVTR